MTSLHITSMKNFMSKLLTSDCFDCFLLEEAVIGTGSTVTIDGHVNQEFYTDADEDDRPAYALRPWSELKSLCFDLIKGKRTPLFFRFVLHLMPEQTEQLLTKENCDVPASNVKALVLTIRFDGTGATLTTGTALNTFLLSKEPDIIWDKALQKYLTLKGIEFEEQ